MLVTLLKIKKIKCLTLVEVLVAVGISLLLIGVSIPLLSREGNRLSLEREAEAIAAYYTKAQNYSFHPERKDVDSYSVVPGDCNSSRRCKRLAIVANYQGEAVEVDSFNIPRAVIKAFFREVPTVEYQLGSGNITSSDSINIMAYFENNPSKPASITIYPTGAVDVRTQNE